MILKMKKAEIFLCIFLLSFSFLFSCKSKSPFDGSLKQDENTGQIEGGALDLPIHHTLFLDEPNEEVNNISDLTAWQYDRVSRVNADKLTEAMKVSIFPLLDSFQLNMLTSNLNLETLLLKTVSTMKDSLLQVCKEVNANLPTDAPIHFMMGFLPWQFKEPFYPSNTNAISFTGYQIGGEIVGQPKDFNKKIEDNIRTLMQLYYKKTQAPVYFLGIVADLALKKDSSQVSIDILLGLTPGESPLEAASNPQVQLTHVVIPEVTDPDKAPTMLLNLTQRLVDEKDQPQSKAEFGPFGGWIEHEIAFQMLDDKQGSIFGCGDRHASAIFLKGNLKSDHWFFKYLIDGRPIEFRIYDMDIDLEQTQIQSLHLYSSLGFKFGSHDIKIGCFAKQDINEQFKDEANKQITEQIETLKKELSADNIMKALLTPPNQP